MADSFQLKALITGVDQLSPKLKSIRGNVARFSKQLKSSGLGEFSFAGLTASVAPLLGAAKAAIDFESAMADVKKVVDFDTPQQFKAMGQDVLALSKRLPMAAKDIVAIVAAGGQAGLGKDNQAELGSEAQWNDYVKLHINVLMESSTLCAVR